MVAAGTQNERLISREDVVAKKTAQKSKILLADIERWQKGVASTDEPNALLPEGVNPVDVAATLSIY